MTFGISFVPLLETVIHCGKYYQHSHVHVRSSLTADLWPSELVRFVPDIVIHTLRFTLLSDSGYARIG
ncbi:hypothetical protein FZO55_17690 [Enterobacter kobei]|nr:hypothetical protein FZO55_17690 [Enterobacter kobei]